MAVVAVVTTGNVSGVFPDRGRSVVTGNTGAYDLRVIHTDDRQPQ